MATVREAAAQLMRQLVNSGKQYEQGGGRTWDDPQVMNVFGYDVSISEDENYDCSGAVCVTYRALNLIPDWAKYASTRTMMDEFCDGVNFRAWPWESDYVTRPGDLVLCYIPNDVGHVAMVVSSDWRIAEFLPGDGGIHETGFYEFSMNGVGWNYCIEMMDALGNQTWVGPNHEYRLASGGSSGGSASASITEDGYWGPDTTRAMQAHYGTYVDGIVSHQWEPNVAANSEVLLRSSWEGDYTATGSPMIRSLQADIGTEQDGIFGEADIVKIKSDLFAGVYGTAGTMDRATVWQIQHQLNGGVWPLRL